MYLISTKNKIDFNVLFDINIKPLKLTLNIQSNTSRRTTSQGLGISLNRFILMNFMSIFMCQR